MSLAATGMVSQATQQEGVEQLLSRRVWSRGAAHLAQSEHGIATEHHHVDKAALLTAALHFARASLGHSEVVPFARATRVARPAWLLPDSDLAETKIRAAV